MKHLNIEIFGKVQGVYYRLTCKSVADQLGVKGFALNRPDGSVYVEAEGDDFSLESLLEFCKEGPERAEVTSVKTEEGPLQHFKNFEVIKKIK
ncbi:acylphosphatase [Sphingobacterium oryzagri]|uniref:acylphosphatase n=1 Tax=Sphingobacterium oryzagri TaxID=3025669 RepID=A0ABY7WJV2_9SPHI|nr:acylphosphatase [Sphingobacterium sp. KACC 22765]WDF69255.1 acylphosphatase [Sphingobacterium sp. KACC 22765]